MSAAPSCAQRAVTPTAERAFTPTGETRAATREQPNSLLKRRKENQPIGSEAKPKHTGMSAAPSCAQRAVTPTAERAFTPTGETRAATREQP
ncbi:hypothetical protein DPX16_4996 [Anabarilius grahami]|uniref:Uncharacterized protein n=1 Tax=Anabarilius grahami TaxID=495550 RepID=A0A3N0YIL5_ANAGA|nr:hypothetical protein DPX16_4996 [Anabarilius grahami]